MFDCSRDPKAIQYTFAVICVASGVLGTTLQVLAAVLNQVGGPRENHVAARLVGAAGTKPQDIRIWGRRAISIVAANVSNAGSTILFASLLAGLVINFPCFWLAGFITWVIALSLPACIIATALWNTLIRVRLEQQRLFNALPQDGPISHAHGITEKAEYRAALLRQTPDLSDDILAVKGFKRAALLSRGLLSIYRIERKRGDRPN